MAGGRGSTLIPLHRRIALLLRSRTRGLGGVILLMGPLALTVQRDFILWVGGIVVAFVAIPLVLAASPRELTGRTAALWFQKPVREVPFALVAFAETLLATVGVAVLFGVACVLVGLELGWEPERPPLRLLPVGVLASFVIASAAFGAAAWFPRGSRILVLALIGLGLFLFEPELSDPELVRGGPIVLARLVLFPTLDLLRLGVGVAGDFPLRPHLVVAPVLYALAWIGVGGLGVWRSAAKGRIGFD